VRIPAAEHDFQHAHDRQQPDQQVEPILADEIPKMTHRLNVPRVIAARLLPK
jgi:hypothetical protein